MTRQLLQNFQEAILPWIFEKMKQKKAKSFERSERELLKPPYIDTYDDWAEMILKV